MKRKSPGRLKSELPTLASDIAEFLDKHAGKSGRNQNLANNLATYLIQKYSVSDHKTGELRRLIELHSGDLAAFLDETKFKEFQALFKMPATRPQPSSWKELAQAILKPPEKLPPSEDEPPRRKKRPRPRPKNDNERTQRRKDAKERYEERRREYRRGLIVEQFGTHPFPTLYPQSTRPEGPCLDVLFRREPVGMAAQAGSLEDLFGMDRKRFPKQLRWKKRGRNFVYYLDAFVQCMTHLLANRGGKEQWLPEGPQRQLVLTGIIARGRRYSSEVGDMLAAELRPYVP